MATVYDFVSGAEVRPSRREPARAGRGMARSARALTSTMRHLVGALWDLAIVVLGLGSLAAFSFLVPFMVKMAAENPFYGVCVFFILRGMFRTLLEIKSWLQ